MTFTERVVISFIIVTAYIVLVGYLTERKNPKLGGFVSAMPSAVLVSIVFITNQDGNAAGAHAALASAVTLAGSVIYITGFAALVNHGAVIAFIIAIQAWVIAALIGLIHIDRAIVPLLILFPCVLIADAISRHSPSDNKNLKLVRPIWLLGIQGAAAGALVALALFSARELGPRWGGAVGGFPVVNTGNLLFFWSRHKSQKELVSFASGAPRGIIATAFWIILYYSLITYTDSLPTSLTISYLATLIFAAIFWKQGQRRAKI